MYYYGIVTILFKLLCKATQQLEGCIFNDLKSTCRLQEVQFFNEIMDMLRHRHRFCQPLGNSRSWRNRIGQRAVQFDDNQLPLPLTKQGKSYKILLRNNCSAL